MEHVVLTTDCPRCKGQGLIPGAELPEICPDCRGKGVVFTEEAKVILGFIRLTERRD